MSSFEETEKLFLYIDLGLVVFASLGFITVLYVIFGGI